MRNTKRRMTASLLALLVCCVMLAGTTFAWFTDTASNTGNRIQAGDLDVDLLMYTGAGDTEDGYESIANQEGDIFAEDGNGVNWEPGKTEIVHLAVRNLGSLALKYNINLNITDVFVDGFAEQFEYAIIGADEPTNGLNVGSWAAIQELTGVLTGNISAGELVAAPNGCLDEIVNGEENETDYFALAVHMKETAGNEYMEGAINIDVFVEATQMTAEFDSFSNQYDAQAAVLKTATVAVTNREQSVTVSPDPETQVVIPPSTLPDTAETVTFNVKNTAAPAAGITVAPEQESQSFEIELLVNGAEAPDLSEGGGTGFYTVTLNVGPGLENIKVYHDGVEMTPVASLAGAAANSFYYDKTTGVLTIWTQSFSPFDIVFDKPQAIEIAVGDFNPSAIEAGKTYRLAEGVHEFNGQLTINKKVTLIGIGNCVLQPTVTRTDNGYNNAIQVVSGSNGAVIENITIDGSNVTKGHGINVFDSAGTLTLKNVKIINNKKSALCINGDSAVKASGLTTSDNAWGSINIDKGTASSPASLVLTGTNSIGAGATGSNSGKIWSEIKNFYDENGNALSPAPASVSVPVGFTKGYGAKNSDGNMRLIPEEDIDYNGEYFIVWYDTLWYE